MDDFTVYQPGRAAGPPVDGVEMEVCGGVEAEVDPAGRATVAEVHRCAVVAGIEVHVGQHPPGIGSRELDVDLLSWCGAVQEESGNESRARRCSNLCLKVPVSERAYGCERA